MDRFCLAYGALGAWPRPLALGLRLDPALSGEAPYVSVGERRVLGDIGGPFLRFECGDDGGDDVLPCLLVGLFCLPVAGGAQVELCERARGFFRHEKRVAELCCGSHTRELSS